ncbi:hypothetical protein [Hymenobacter cavernae]|uniref:ATP-dependent DNA helicase n=1 Tax=Hymenobacter cavernae TaxID=2044852 RepID=A0ABQ1UWA3_9BACT|nr:hypothetical protein [Hymenobacter cavernae]GGF26791.1 hypothetical protein GCM10011383_42930 [Hymenobacter cavernae]
MKTSLLSFAAAVAMLATTQSFAAPAPIFDHHDNDRRERNYKDDRKAAAERARLEAARRRMELERQRREAAERARWEAQQRRNSHSDRYDRNDRDFNYGYDRNHRVTPAERARWEAAHRNDYGRR